MKKVTTYRSILLSAFAIALLLTAIFARLDDWSIALGISPESMALVWIYSLVSVLLVSLVSLVGIMALGLNVNYLDKVLLLLVSISIGTLLGGAFLHLIPEAVEGFGFTTSTSFYILLGIIVFFAVEKFVQWHHCHHPPHTHDTGHRHPKSFATMNLVGDSLHNLIDGIIIGGSYLVSIPLGVATTIAVIIHEAPQEISDFGVLIFGGYSRKKALLFNFLTALTAVVGTVLALSIGPLIEGFTGFIIPFTAGAFLYIASADLIPELHKEMDMKKSFMQFVGIIIGIAIMFWLTLLE